MPLHLTKVAFGVASLEAFVARWAAREGDPPYELGTRYLPKRWEEIAGQGSLFWILKHQLVARSPIIGFGELPGGRTAIKLDPRVWSWSRHGPSARTRAGAISKTLARRVIWVRVARGLATCRPT